LLGVVNELNITIAALIPDSRVVIELVRWETHASPAIGRPQAIINEQVGPYDIFVGIMWKRFGTPTGVAEGGTEEELRLALRRWQANRQPHIMFYFSSAPSSPPTTEAEVAQLAKVVAFRTELSKRALVWPYPDSVRFAEVVRPHLASAIGQMIRPTTPPPNPSERPTPGRRTTTSSGSPPRERLELEILEIAPEDAHVERAIRLALTRRYCDAGLINDCCMLILRHEGGEAARAALDRRDFQPFPQQRREMLADRR